MSGTSGRPGPVVYDRRRVDRDQPFRPRERLDDEPGGSGMNVADVFTHGPIHHLAVAHVGEIHHQLDHVLHVAARFFHQLPGVLHHLACLVSRVTAVDVIGTFQVVRALSPQEHHRAPGDDRLAQVVAQRLLRVGVPGVVITNGARLSTGRSPALEDGRNRAAHFLTTSSASTTLGCDGAWLSETERSPTFQNRSWTRGRTRSTGSSSGPGKCRLIRNPAPSLRWCAVTV